MATTVNLLQLSPTMKEGRIVKWLVKEGDEVRSGQPIAEIETDKAVMEQESFEDGKVLKVLAKEGAKIAVEAPILIIGEEGEDISGVGEGGSGKAKEPAPAEKKKDAPARPAQRPSLPSRGSSNAPIPGTVDESKTPEDKRPAPPKQEPRKVDDKQGASAKPAPAPQRESNGGRVTASPLARKMAQEKGLDLNALSGSGPAGRIIRRDIEQAIQGGGARVAASAGAPAGDGIEEVVELSGMRQTIARRLTESKQSVPHFQLTIEVRAKKMLAFVQRLKETHPEAKVSVTHVLMKAMAATLMRHKWVRGQWDGDRINIIGAAHISVAVALEDGLVTPVVRNCERKGIIEIARETRELAELAKARKLKLEQMTGGVQTVSNLGMFGIHEFNAIINPPESTILAIGATEERPIVDHGELKAAKVMRITMSCDHRVVDGAVGAKYLADLKNALEDPAMMLL